jgi:YD repeat-containing protein
VIRRREKILDHYFRQLNPLEGFVVDGALSFRNLGGERALAPVEAYEFQWFAFDNLTGERTALGDTSRATETRIPLPGGGAGEYRVVRIRTLSAAEPRWSKAVEVYLRGVVIIGIDREI